MLAAVMIFVSLPTTRTSALPNYDNYKVRVGLAYGSNEKGVATLQVASGTGTGFKAGYVDPSNDEFKPYYTVNCTKVDVIRDYGMNYNVYSGSYVYDGADANSCVGRWHIEIQVNYDNQSELDAAVSAAYGATGYVSFPAFTQSGYRVRIGRFTSSSAANEDKDTILQRLNATSKFATVTVSTVASGSNGYTVVESGTRNILFEWDGATKPLALQATGGSAPETYMKTVSGTTVLTHRYHGVMDFGSSSSNSMSVINVVPLGLYIRGVVPYEIGMGYPDESTKAMAVIAATFAVYNEGRHSSYGVDVCTGQHCQVYRGIGSSSKRYETQQIIDCCNAVDGMVITYNGKPIQAVYHASNGGFTEDCENVWVAEIPYLKSIIDEYEGTTEGATAAQNGVWSKTLTGEQIASRLKSYGLGTVTSVEVTKRSAAGSVVELSVSDGSKTVVLKKEDMRLKMGTDVLLSQNFKVLHEGSVYVNDGVQLESGLSGAYVMGADGVAVALPDTARTVLTADGQTVVNDASGGANEWTFDGKGWGHSLGLSQWGAIGMGRKGFTFDQIIKYYYTGVEISGFDY